MTAAAALARVAGRWALVPVLLAVATLGLAACGGGAGEGAEPRGEGAGAGPLLIFAAADLQAAFAEVVALHTERGGEAPVVVFGSTGNLATQIEHGAPADLFFAANEAFVDRLATAGRIVEESRRIYAYGRLALVWREGVAPLAGVEELARPEIRTVAIANPEHAPYGVAAREALQAAGVWEAVQPRLVAGENIAQALQFVRTGNADAGIVALGLVLGPEARPHLLISDSLHAPLRQATAIVRGSPRAAAAGEFLDLLASPAGDAILRRYGFVVPGR